jgi:alcohol dehydrogenase, propanol-preferring
MRAMRLVSEGRELQASVLEKPRPVGSSVVVKVAATGVCHTDLHLISGSYDLGDGRRLSATGGGKNLPLTPGHEIAGTVDELGVPAGSGGVREGMPVVVYPWIGCGSCRKCRSGSENLCEGTPAFLGFTRDGGYAEYVLVPDTRYLVRADGLDASQSATLACSGLTALSAIRKCALDPDDLLLVVGAGGVGSTAIQIAKKTTQARVVVVDVDESKLELAARLGADSVLNTRQLDAATIVSRVRGLNQGRGVDAIADFVGTPATTSVGFRLLGREGKLVLVGLVGGAGEFSLPLFPLRGAQVRGSFTGTLAELVDLVEMARQGVLSPVVAGVYGLEQANEALANLARGGVVGRAVLRP